MKKYRFRIFISILIYIFFRLTGTNYSHSFFIWDHSSTVYVIYTVSVVMIAWEVVAWSITYFHSRSGINSNADLFRISIKSGLIILPLVLLFSYISHEVISPYVDDSHTIKNFWAMSAQGFVLCQIIILYEIIRLYIKHTVNEAREKEQIKKELVAAQYEGLKNQINPHFLFNSFSVLSSLVEKDSEMAIEFISKLSDLYRYILENDEKSMVTLQEEMDFLEDYLFLLKMRHQSSLIIEKQLSAVSMEVMIPPMSLQILVENAVKHNSFSKDEPLKIIISATLDHSIQVSNRKVEKKELARSTGIGLNNLSKRLKLAVGKGLVIVEDDKHFNVQVPLT